MLVRGGVGWACFVLIGEELFGVWCEGLWWLGGAGLGCLGFELIFDLGLESGLVVGLRCLWCLPCVVGQ